MSSQGKRLDPRAALLVVVFFSVFSATSGSFVFLFLIFLYELWLLAFFLKMNFVRLFRMLVSVNLFLALISATLFASLPLKTALKISLLIVARSNLTLILIISLLSGYSAFELAGAMRFFGIPKKLILLLLFCHRYFYSLKSEYETMMRAALCRGFRPSTSIITYKTYASFLALLLARIYVRSKNIHKAMILRGVETGIFSLYRSAFGKRDVFFCLGSLFYLMVALRWSY